MGNTINDWLSRLSDWPRHHRSAHGNDEQIALYVSGSSVATVTARFSAEGEAGAAQMCLYASQMEQASQFKDLLTTQVDTLSLQRHPARKRCNLVLAPDMYNLVLLDRPDVADDEVADAVRWLIQDQVDFDMETASLDVFELPKGASRERRMVYAAALPQAFLKSVVAQIYATGLELQSIDLTELALRNLSWSCFPDADQNVAVLRLTSNSGLINISRGDELYLSRRVKGLPDVVSENQWDAFRERLLLQVQRSIDYYESAMGQPHCDVLVIACTHEWAGLVTDYFAEMMPIPIRRVDEVLAHEMQISLFNSDQQQKVDWSVISDAQVGAIAAGLPAIGGALRHRLAEPMDEVA